jgi:hypothetical protein
MRRAALAVLCACGLAGAAHAAAVERILVPSVRTPLDPGPPLLGNGLRGETVFPGHIASDERVVVGIDASGAPASVDVVQRLRIARTGDYTFTVSGPIADVAAASGTDSEPGLRTDAIVWSGFSPGHKTLAARATLRVDAAAQTLPLRITRQGDVLRIENTTAARAQLLAGPASAADVAAVLDQTRRGLAAAAALPDAYVHVTATPHAVVESIFAPLEVSGSVGGVEFAHRLGDGSPNSFVVHLPHAATAKLHLVATPVAPSQLLTPPGGAATWREAVRAGRVAPADLLPLVSRVRETIARALQYGEFLANPDPFGTSSASYVYETAAAPPPRAAPAPSRPGGGGWQTLAVAAACILGAGGLLALWARS